MSQSIFLHFHGPAGCENVVAHTRNVHSARILHVMLSHRRFTPFCSIIPRARQLRVCQVNQIHAACGPDEGVWCNFAMSWNLTCLYVATLCFITIQHHDSAPMVDKRSALSARCRLRLSNFLTPPLACDVLRSQFCRHKHTWKIGSRSSSKYQAVSCLHDCSCGEVERRGGLLTAKWTRSDLKLQKNA